MRKNVIGVLLGAAAIVGLAGPAAAAPANQQFRIVARFEGNDTTSCQVIATGPISGVGTCTIDQVSDNVTLIHLMLPNGNVDVRAKQFQSSDQFNQAACTDRFGFKENFRIVGGTGAYANATGSGTDTGTGVFTLPRTAQGCDFEQGGSGFVVATATGHVNLGNGGASSA